MKFFLLILVGLNAFVVEFWQLVQAFTYYYVQQVHAGRLDHYFQVAGLSTGLVVAEVTVAAFHRNH